MDLVTTLIVNSEKLQIDLGVLLSCKDDHELVSVTIDSIKKRITTITYCFSQLYANADNYTTNEVNGRDIVSSFQSIFFTKLLLSVALRNNKSIRSVVPIIEKLREVGGLDELCDTYMDKLQG